MLGRALDANNDLIVENGQFRLVQDGAEIVQHVRTRLLFYFEEWFLDTQAGVPYFQLIFTKPADLATIESVFKTTIIRTPGVQELTFFSMDFQGGTTRKLTVNFSAVTEFGIITNETINING